VRGRAALWRDARLLGTGIQEDGREQLAQRLEVECSRFFGHRIRLPID
jgi:hypothetical protein